MFDSLGYIDYDPDNLNFVKLLSEPRSAHMPIYGQKNQVYWISMKMVSFESLAKGEYDFLCFERKKVNCGDNCP